MKRRFLFSFLTAFIAVTLIFAQSPVEMQVLKKIQQIARSGQPLHFSELYNSKEFDAREKTFLGHLYEVFFQIPPFLQQRYQTSGKIPTRKEIGRHFQISVASVGLLLKVMQSDPRLPPLFEMDEQSGRITRLNQANIEAFASRRGKVHFSQWKGKSLPDFALRRFRGGTISKSDLAGKSGLIYFWFTGCPPCGRITPLLVKLNREFASRGFEIVGFNADKVLGLSATDAQRKSYLDSHDVRFPNAHLDDATRKAFGNVNIFPTLFLFKPDGTIAEHLVNFQDYPSLESAAKSVLQK